MSITHTARKSQCTMHKDPHTSPTRSKRTHKYRRTRTHACTRTHAHAHAHADPTPVKSVTTMHAHAIMVLTRYHLSLLHIVAVRGFAEILLWLLAGACDTNNNNSN